MRTETITVSGINSEQAAATVRASLLAVEGISDATVSLLRSQVDVEFDESRLDLRALEDALAKAGFRPVAGQGSCCGGCCS